MQVAYHANRDGQRQYDPEEQPQKSKKEQNRENTKSLAKDAGAVALQGMGVPGPLAGKAAEKAAKNPLVNHALNKVSDKLNKNPLVSAALNKVANSPARNAAKGAIGSKNGDPGSTKDSGENNKNSNSTENQGETQSQGSKLGKLGLGKNPFSSNSKADGQAGAESQGSFEGMVKFAKTMKKLAPILGFLGSLALPIFGIMIILGAIGSFFPMFGTDKSYDQGGVGGIEYVTDSEEELNFYDRIDTVRKEYEDKGATYKAEYISGTYFIMNLHDPEYTFDDMSESDIRTLSELMFKKSKIVITCEKDENDFVTVEGTKEAEPVCPDGYTLNPDRTAESYIFDEESFKTDLAKFMQSKLNLTEDSEAAEVADEVYEYIADYNSLTVREETSVKGNGNLSYWWPVGSNETTEVNGVLFATGAPASTHITSDFGGRYDPFSGKWVDAHGAIDIAGGGIIHGSTSAIAAKDGIVEKVSTGCISFGSTSCGGGFGNYVVLKHSDGNYTIYAHLQQNTITVNKGDTVAQGQVLGRIGSSGRSTNTHLHFEVRVGQNINSAHQDPLNFVDPENPRPTSMGSSNFVEMLYSWEGTGPADTNNYYVYQDSSGNLTVGHGLLLRYNIDRLSAFGVNASALKAGDPVPRAAAEGVEQQILTEKRSSITTLLSREGITLEEYQIDALVIRMYNVGNINGFAENYKTYGNTQELYDHYMSQPTTSGGKVLEGLRRRRAAEWTLFSTGVYQKNG